MLVASLVVAGFATQAGAAAQAPAPAPPNGPLVPREWLVIAPVDARGRRPFNPSATFAKHLLDPDAPAPKEGEALTGELGKEQAWTKRSADEKGGVGGSPIQMAFTAVEWPEAGIALADLDGAGTVWVNGVPQIGDVYGDGMGGLPVAMRKGANAIFVTGMRGSFRLELTKPPSGLLVNPFDATVPDLVAGSTDPVSVGLLLVNATDQEVRGLHVETGSDDESTPFQLEQSALSAVLPPRGLLKIEATFTPRDGDPVFAKEGARVVAPVKAMTGAQTASSQVAFTVKRGGSLRRETFLSELDGSIQSYAVLPPTGGDARALVLTLHGAGVEDLGQAAAYSAKPDFWIVAPTNRRRFGFDWQDWGRRDAYEVLELAIARFGIDPRRVYLTGHSMGGHGTWHLAANDPATFAAIAPSAGWSSFDSYGGGRPKGALAELWQQSDGASRTLSLVDNLKQVPTFVLHGADDDNVPLGEAKLMIDALTKAGATPQSHFQEGAGHWWDVDPAPGADCVDWPAIFDLFRAHARPDVIPSVSFTGNDPSVRSSCDWVEVRSVERYGEPFHVQGTWDAAKSEGVVTTKNVRALSLWVPEGTTKSVWLVDGERFEGGSDVEELPRVEGEALLYRADVMVTREKGRWTTGGSGPAASWTTLVKRASDDSAAACGPFKRVFERRFALVYGTKGNEAETRELRERARYDAMQWWYRANGRAVVLSDVEWRRRRGGGGAIDSEPTGHVVLYGNRDTNAAWEALIPAEAPFDAARGKLRLGKKSFEGNALGACVVLPNLTCGLVGCFADTGPRGSRLGYTLAPFLSGVGYPDYALFSADVLTKGDAAILAAGFFDARWTLPD